MPFGLTNTPVTFMALMQRIFGDLAGKGVEFFVDDISVHSASRERHLELL